jgi:hypothetical protein
MELKLTPLPAAHVKQPDKHDPNGARGKPAAMAARAIARRLVAQFVRLVSISSND